MTVQHVTVKDGGQAVVAQTMRAAARLGAQAPGENSETMSQPDASGAATAQNSGPDWRRAMALAQAARRCTARCKHSKAPCRGQQRGRNS